MNCCRASASLAADQRAIVGQALPLANFFGVRCRRVKINRLGQFDMANRPGVYRGRLVNIKPLLMKRFV